MPRAPGWRSAGVNAAVVLASVVFSLAAGEIGLRRVATWLPAAPHRDLVDPLLEVRGNPAFPEHDSRGFRNTSALDRADVVLLGDSLTYGLRVPPDETWGRVLAAETGAVVYNMAIPGWGPRQAAFVLPDALALKPKTVLYGFYFGNDIVDALAACREYRPTDPPPPPPPSGGVHGFVHRYSWIYREVRNLLGPLPGHARRWAESDPDVTFFEGARWRTIFAVPWRLCLLDSSDPRIRAGVEVVKSVLLGMARDVEDAGAAFAVALLPNKESVFAPRVTDVDAHEGLAALVAAESRLRDELTDVLCANGVSVIDLLPPLRDAPEQPFPVGRDSHPNAAGHRAIGLAVARAVRGMR